jgi:hypothetical protein
MTVLAKYPGGRIHQQALSPLLLYTELSLMITVLPLNVVTCFAFPRFSRTLFSSLEFAEPVWIGMRSTWLPRNSSDETRSEYSRLDSRSREPMRDSVVGTSKTWGTHAISISHSGWSDARFTASTYMILDRYTLARDSASEEGTEERV